MTNEEAQLNIRSALIHAEAAWKICMELKIAGRLKLTVDPEESLQHAIRDLRKLLQ